MAEGAGHSNVRQQLDQFKQQVHEAAQQIAGLEELLTTLENKIGEATVLVTQGVEELKSEFDDVERLIEDMLGFTDKRQAELLKECTDAEHGAQQEASQLEQRLAECDTDNGQYVRELEEHDHTVEQHIQDAKKAAEKLLERAKETAEGVIQTAKSTGEKVVHGVEEGAKAAGKAAHDAYEGAQQIIKEAAEGLKSHGNDWGSLVRDQAQHFAENIQGQDQQMQAHLQDTLRQLTDRFGGDLGKVLQEGEQFAHGVGTVMDTVAQLAGHGVETVGTLTDAMEATNVGMNTAIGIFTKTKDTFQEVADLF